MFRLNFEDGRTVSFDLDDRESRAEWEAIESQPAQQKKIRGSSMSVEAHTVAVTQPKKFESLAWSAEKVEGRSGEVVGSRVECQADNVRLSIVLYDSGLVRVDLRRTGKPRFLTQFKT